MRWGRECGDGGGQWGWGIKNEGLAIEVEGKEKKTGGLGSMLMAQAVMSAVVGVDGPSTVSSTVVPAPPELHALA